MLLDRTAHPAHAVSDEHLDLLGLKPLSERGRPDHVDEQGRHRPYLVARVVHRLSLSLGPRTTVVARQPPAASICSAAVVEWVIEVVGGPDTGTWCPVGAELEIGRKAFGRDPGGLRLRDRMVSRHHARISADGRTVVLEDLGSTNGTLVSDEEVRSLAVLSAGDRIQVGISMLELRPHAHMVPRADTGRSGSSRPRARRRIRPGPVIIAMLVWFSAMLYLAIR